MDYQKDAVRTAANNIFLDLEDQQKIDILHGAMGLATEAGELLDAVKKMLFYGRTLDTTNIFEELGDIEWYMALIRETFGWTQEMVQERNIAKLKARYPEKFTTERALERDLDTERNILEGRQ